MKYDDASWHSGGEFPAELPASAAGTHTGMFLSWAIFAGLAHEWEDGVVPIEDLRERRVTPGAFFLVAYDGKLTNDCLNERGNAFAQAYFKFDVGAYLADYEDTLASELPSLYHVPDSWANYKRLAPVLDRRLTEWAAKAER